MSGPPLSSLGLPRALCELLASIYGDTESARRAALAPWPELEFQSAVQKATLFADDARGDSPERLKLQQLLRSEQPRFALDQPFFVSPGTKGTLRSPYPELTDAEYWTFVVLWEDEKVAQEELSAKYGVLDDQSGIEYLRRFRRPGVGAWLDRVLHGPTGAATPLQEVYVAHCRNRGGVYS